ncbi:hypothetical protein VNO78_21236 [Psophocarpus tetragonolobus]|uniref:Protein kinase domain-containing protein n=1 Tax=Psophocarpus tetragonolobus TaxID=3891 RepID=A0AAN9SAQ7_PSOTE
MTIFVSTSDLKLSTPVLVVDLDLSKLLPEDVFVGFSASTGVYTQVNTIKSWYFSSWEYIEKNPINLIWLWILIPIIVVACGLGGVCYWRKKHRKEQGVEEDLNIELEIKNSSNAPHRFQLKEILSGTRNFHSSNKLGYMAPESFHTRRASVETDVYAFGVLMLEVVCGGRRPEHKEDTRYCSGIVDWVWELHCKENITGAVDLRLNGHFDKAQAKCVLELGLACCNPNPYERPSMRTVLQMLIGEADPPFVALEKPAFTWPATAPVLSELSSQATVSQNEPITELTSGR